MTYVNGLLANWLAAESNFKANLYNGDGASAVEIVEASTRPWLVLTAPHAVNHCRAGAQKLADRGTGGLVRVLSSVLGCFGVITARQSRTDASYDELDDFKNALAKLPFPIGAIIDFHGMSNQRDLDVEMGFGLLPTVHSKTMAVKIGTSLERANLRVAYNEKYVSLNPKSITNWALSLDIPSIQVELAARARPPLGDTTTCATLMTTLERVLRVDAPEALWQSPSTERPSNFV